MVLVTVERIEDRTEWNENYNALREQKKLSGRYEFTLTYKEKVAGGIEKLPKFR